MGHRARRGPRRPGGIARSSCSRTGHKGRRCVRGNAGRRQHASVVTDGVVGVAASFAPTQRSRVQSSMGTTRRAIPGSIAPLGSTQTSSSRALQARPLRLDLARTEGPSRVSQRGEQAIARAGSAGGGRLALPCHSQTVGIARSGNGNPAATAHAEDCPASATTESLNVSAGQRKWVDMGVFEVRIEGNAHVMVSGAADLGAASAGRTRSNPWPVRRCSGSRLTCPASHSWTRVECRPCVWPRRSSRWTGPCWCCVSL